MIECGPIEDVPPDGYLQPSKRREHYQCGVCGHKWHRDYKVVPKNPPPCPKRGCAERAALAQLRLENDRLTAMLLEQRGPAQIGANTQVKAIDETARIVMEDHKMTDLRDNIRAGDSAAPPLPPAQQKAADNYFGPSGAIPIVGGSGRTMPGKQMSRLGQRAIAGAFRNMAVAPNAVTPDAAKGQPALRVVRTEQIQGNRRG